MDWQAGYPERFRFLDDEHEALVQALEDFKSSTAAGLGRGPKAKALRILSLLRAHIKNEEDVMKNCDYPEVDLHKKHHEVLLDSFWMVLEFFDREAMLEHRERIVNYIEGRLSEEMFIDRLLAKFLRDREAAE